LGYLKTRKKVLTLDRPISVLYDDREKKGRWRLNSPDYVMSRCRLPVGDYTINGWSDQIIIERKRNLKEFITNIGGRDRKRFVATLEKMSEFSHAYIVIEDTLDTKLFDVFRSLPTKLAPYNVYYWLNKIIVYYNIPVLFIGRDPRIRRDMILQLFEFIVKEIEYGSE
jgi:ERCC4-type nuclease